MLQLIVLSIFREFIISYCAQVKIWSRG